MLKGVLMSSNMAKRNPHIGANFDDVLQDEGIFEEVQAKALKRALAEKIDEGRQAAAKRAIDIAKLRLRN